MKQRTPRSILAYLVLGGLALSIAGVPAEVRGDREDERAMKKKMNEWARALGVRCGYCHVQNGRVFDYEADTPRKAIAHYMEEHFTQRLDYQGRRVTCQDCHRGRARFLPRPDGADLPPPPPGSDEPPPDEEPEAAGPPSPPGPPGPPGPPAPAAPAPPGK